MRMIHATRTDQTASIQSSRTASDEGGQDGTQGGDGSRLTMSPRPAFGAMILGQPQRNALQPRLLQGELGHPVTPFHGNPLLEGLAHPAIRFRVMLRRERQHTIRMETRNARMRYRHLDGVAAQTQLIVPAGHGGTLAQEKQL